MRDEQTTEQLKIELLSQWKLEAESRNWSKTIKTNLKAFFLMQYFITCWFAKSCSSKRGLRRGVPAAFCFIVFPQTPAGGLERCPLFYDFQPFSVLTTRLLSRCYQSVIRELLVLVGDGFGDKPVKS